MVTLLVLACLGLALGRFASVWTMTAGCVGILVSSVGLHVVQHTSLTHDSLMFLAKLSCLQGFYLGGATFARCET